MMKKLSAALALALCVRVCGAAGAGGADDAALAGFEKQILQSVSHNNYVDAIQQSGDYEVALRNLSQTATFANGAVTSDEFHLSFDAPFAADWKTDDSTAASKMDLQRSGVQLIIGRKSADGFEQLRMIVLDMKAQLRRAGLKDPLTVQMVQDTSKGISQELGTIQDESVENVGGMNVVRTHITGEGIVGDAAAFERDGEIFYVFVKGPSTGDVKVPHDRIDALIKSVKFTPEAKDVADRVAAIEAKPGTVAEDLLPRVRELAAMGEYREAVLELLDVRVDIQQRLPGPKVSDDKIAYADYGITITNPDQAGWKCNSSNVGAVKMLQLQDKTSTTEGFVAVLVMDPVLCFGPFIAKDLEPGASPEASKNMLMHIGQGSLNNIARPILKEQFREFHGLPAYEGIVAGKDGTFQMKLIAVMGPKATYEIMMYASPDNIEKYTGVAEQDIVIEGGK